MAFVNPSSRWSGCRCAACFDCPMPRLLPGSLKEGWGGGGVERRFHSEVCPLRCCC
jgi:hypothetical protein